MLPQGLRDGLGSVASAKLGLSFFQVAADCLLAKTESFRDLAGVHPRRDQPQNRKLPRRQLGVLPKYVRIRIDELISGGVPLRWPRR